MARWSLRVLALALVSLPAVALAQPVVNTFTLSAPTSMPSLPSGQYYALTIDYSFAGDDLEDATIFVDIPGNVILVDVGDNAPFSTYCTYTSDPAFDPAYDWWCELTATTLDVGAGAAGQLVLRVNPARFAFVDGQQITFTATLSASNLGALVSDQKTVTIPTTPVTLYDYPTIDDYATVEMPSSVNGTATIGIGSTVYRSIYNTGTGFIGRGAEVRSTIASPYTTYALPPYYTSIWAVDIVPWVPITTLSATYPRLLGPAGVQVYSNDPDGLRGAESGGSSSPALRVWRECGEPLVPSELTPQVFGTLVPGGPNQELSLGQRDYFTHNGGTSDFDCETGSEIGIYDQQRAVAGASYYVSAYFNLPMGNVPLYDLYAVIELDSDLTYTGASTYAYNMETGHIPPLDLYGCVFTGNADLAEFQASQACDWLGTSYTYAPIAGYTHLVAYAPEYVYEESYGRAVGRQFTMTLDAFLSCSLGGTELRHEAALEVRRVAGGAPEVSPWIAVENVVDDESPVYVDGPYFYGANNQIISVNRGETFVLATNLYNNALMKNPTAVYRLPPGIDLVAVHWLDDAYYGYESSCESPDVDVSLSVDQDGFTIVELTMRAEGGGTWYRVPSCEASDCEPAGNGQPELVLYVDPTHPWRDGDQALFESDWDADNNVEDYVAHVQGSLTVNVPIQQRLLIEPICEGTAGPGDCGNPTASAGRRPGLRVTMQNRGGIDLTNVLGTVHLPKVGDGSGTLADTVFHSLVPGGATLTCLSSGTPAPCGIDTTSIEAFEADLAPQETSVFEIYFDVDPSAQTGTPIYGRGSLASSELASVPAASVSPVRVNLCPGTLDALVFFDTNKNGVQDGDERALADWVLALTTQGLGTSTFELGTAGTLSLLVAEGTYAWSAYPNHATEGTFFVVPPVQGDLELCPDGTTSLVIPVNCNCDDGIACTVDTCNFLGQCTHVWGVGPIEGVPDNTCDGIDQDCDFQVDEDFVPYATTCTNQYNCVGTGTATCNWGTLTNSCVAPYPGTEVCDGIDNNCDGKTDGDDPWLQVPPCYDQDGVCRGAYKTPDMCITTIDWQGRPSGYWVECQTEDYILNAYYWTDSHGFPGQYTYEWYERDFCDGLDNDCDTFTDENFVGQPITCGSGPCQVTTSTTCADGLEVSTCEPRWDLAENEVCDGIDNDCDGLIDQADPDLQPEPCESEYGVCVGLDKPPWLCEGENGWRTCGPADYAYLAYPDFRADDDCDGEDNDCDGQADEHFASYPVECQGSCSALGTVFCDDGTPTNTCTGGASAPEICDGIDNDCDGLVDASDPNFVREPCLDQDGVCEDSLKPLALCRGTQGWGDCTANDYAAHAFPAYALTDLYCDNLDNDCDGSIDEDFVGNLALCPAGSCYPAARERCVGGTLQSGCTPTGPGCPGGQPVECDEAGCDTDVELVVYGVATDLSGVPVGSYRCTWTIAGVACDVDEDGALAISDALWCGP